MTKLMTFTEFVKDNGYHCPVCRSNDLTYGDREEDGSMKTFCGRCGAIYYETYELSGYEIITQGKPPHTVIIEVLGGVAEVTAAPAGIEVVIIDHDNEEDEED